MHRTSSAPRLIHFGSCFGEPRAGTARRVTSRGRRRLGGEQRLRRGPASSGWRRPPLSSIRQPPGGADGPDEERPAVTSSAPSPAWSTAPPSSRASSRCVAALHAQARSLTTQAPPLRVAASEPQRGACRRARSDYRRAAREAWRGAAEVISSVGKWRKDKAHCRIQDCSAGEENNGCGAYCSSNAKCLIWRGFQCHSGCVLVPTCECKTSLELEAVYVIFFKKS